MSHKKGRRQNDGDTKGKDRKERQKEKMGENQGRR